MKSQWNESHLTNGLWRKRGLGLCLIACCWLPGFGAFAASDDRDRDLKDYKAATDKMRSCYVRALRKIDTGETPMDYLKEAVMSVCYDEVETACKSSRRVNCMDILRAQIVYTALEGRKKRG